MASKNSRQHGASASSRRTTASRGRSGSGSTARARDRKTTARSTRPARASSRRTPARASTPRPRWFVPFTIVAAVGMLAWSFYAPLKMHYTETREQHRLETELAGLQERNATLKDQVERLKTPEGVEEVARSSLGLVKEGENLYVVIDPDEATSTAGSVPASGESVGEDSLWSAVLDLVFGVR